MGRSAAQVVFVVSWLVAAAMLSVRPVLRPGGRAATVDEVPPAAVP